MADVKIVDIDGEQWNIKDQDARNKNTEQDTKIENLTTEINAVKESCERFYYDSNKDRNVLQNRIDAMIYCYNNSKSNIVTIRYSGGFYYNVIMPSAALKVYPIFTEITYSGDINMYRIRSNAEFELFKSF